MIEVHRSLLHDFWQNHRKQMQTLSGKSPKSAHKKLKLIAPLFFKLLHMDVRNLFEPSRLLAVGIIKITSVYDDFSANSKVPYRVVCNLLEGGL